MTRSEQAAAYAWAVAAVVVPGCALIAAQLPSPTARAVTIVAAVMTVSWLLWTAMRPLRRSVSDAGAHPRVAQVEQLWVTYRQLRSGAMNPATLPPGTAAEMRELAEFCQSRQMPEFAGAAAWVAHAVSVAHRR